MSIPSSYTSGSIGGGNSPSGDVKLQYLGFQQSRNLYNLVTNQTYQGTKERLQHQRDTVWINGTWDTNLGRLQNVDIKQQAGPFYVATVTWTKPISPQITINMDSDQPQERNLEVAMISKPIETHPNYDYRWNHTLIATTSAAANATYLFPQLDQLIASITNPYTGNTLTKNDRWDEAIAIMLQRKGKDQQFKPTLNLRWLDESTTPDRGLADFTELDATTRKPKGKNYPWRVAFYPRKPGVDHYEIATYVLTESGRYNSRNNCSWCIKQGGGLAFPFMGDFGIQAYYHPAMSNITSSQPPSAYWKCQGGTIEYDGKYYNASCKYTWSPDPKGWDLEINRFYISWAQYCTDTRANQNKDVIVQRSSGSNILNPIFNFEGNISNPIL